VKRWTWNLLAAVSLLAFIGTAVMWPLCQSMARRVTYEGPAYLVIALWRPMGLYLAVGMRPESGLSVDAPGLAFGSAVDVSPRSSWTKYLHFAEIYAGRFVTTGDARRITFVILPWWLMLLATAPLPLLWAIGWRRRRRGERRGLCAVCGYDLRASPERCPECGSPVPDAVCHDS
jgi:hypothetical protein